MSADHQGLPTVGALVAGESWAWAALHRECAPGVANFLAASGVDDVDLAVGEVFVHVARRVASFAGEPAGLRVLVFGVARRYVREDPSLAGRLAASSGVSDVGRLRARAVLAELDADQRDVLLLAVAGGLTRTEVAEVLGREPAWVEATEREATDTLGGVVF